MPWTRLRVVTEYVIKSRSKQTRATQRTRLLSGYVYKLASTKTAKNWLKGARTLTKSQKAFAPFEKLQRHGQRRPLPHFTQGKGVDQRYVTIWREVSPKLAKRVVLTRINRREVSQEQHQNKNLHFPLGDKSVICKDQGRFCNWIKTTAYRGGYYLRYFKPT